MDYLIGGKKICQGMHLHQLLPKNTGNLAQKSKGYSGPYKGKFW